METRRIHYISGLIITIFIGLHLFNHCYSIGGAGKHIGLMTTLRQFYRNIFVETILLLAVAVQIFSGIRLFKTKRKTSKYFFEKLHIWTGFYLAIFLVIHLSAVFAGRLLLHLDTNFYFGVAGLNSFPANLFFIPYYALAIISFFGHIAAIHSKKMQHNILGMAPVVQSKLIVASGIFLTLIIFYGLTDRFQGVEIPAAYQVLIGK
jgi:succinate dehydrogenase/fumarate reductase cytochrome b subunit